MPMPITSVSIEFPPTAVKVLRGITAASGHSRRLTAAAAFRLLESVNEVLLRAGPGCAHESAIEALAELRLSAFKRSAQDLGVEL